MPLTTALLRFFAYQHERSSLWQEEHANVWVSNPLIGRFQLVRNIPIIYFEADSAGMKPVVVFYAFDQRVFGLEAFPHVTIFVGSTSNAGAAHQIFQHIAIFSNPELFLLIRRELS